MRAVSNDDDEVETLNDDMQHESDQDQLGDMDQPEIEDNAVERPLVNQKTKQLEEDFDSNGSQSEIEEEPEIPRDLQK